MEGRLVHEVRAEGIGNAIDPTSEDRQTDSRGAYFPKKQRVSNLWPLALRQCHSAEWRSKVSKKFACIFDYQKNDNCSIKYFRLTGLENTLLGLSSRVHPVIWSRAKSDPSTVDSICFGHVLFEMCAGYELCTPQPTPGHLLDIQEHPQVTCSKLLLPYNS